ncbi:MAG TPA: rod shape-determining protein MreC [Clostridiales bacterium]|nr:rod shape-determining protein MreC [Clostridiales bacterium]
MIAAVICVAIAIFTGVSGQDSLLSRAVGTMLRPAQRAITHTAVHAADRYNKYFRYDQLVAENELLKKQVSDLNGRLEDAQAAVKENQDLRAMLGVAERNTSFVYASAEVIGRTLDEWSSVLTIDAGSADGLEKNDSVVTPQGMVGYISSLSEHSAQVTTIIDSNMSAGARMVRTGEIAVAQGDYQLMGNGKLKVRYLSRGADVVVGDTVQTSGSGGIFPKGLAIGTVESIQTESDGMSNYAVIEPMVEIPSLTRVFIITDIKADGQ